MFYPQTECKKRLIVLGEKPVVLVEVQSETEEAETLIRTCHQQHEELLDDALREGAVKVEAGETCQPPIEPSV